LSHINRSIWVLSFWWFLMNSSISRMDEGPFIGPNLVTFIAPAAFANSKILFRRQFLRSPYAKAAS